MGVNHIVPIAANDRVIPTRGPQRVIARTADQQIAGVIAVKRIVKARSGQVFDAREDIAQGIAGLRLNTPQVGDHTGPCACIAGGVNARAAIQTVCPGTADQGVVAIKTEKRVSVCGDLVAINVSIGNVNQIIPGCAGNNAVGRGGTETFTVGLHCGKQVQQ